MKAPSLPGIALGSLPLTLFLMVCFVGLIAFVKLPWLGLQLEPLVCEAGETMVSETQTFLTSEGSGEDIVYYCEGSNGRTLVQTATLMAWAVASYAGLWMLIVWPIVTIIQYRMAVRDGRLEREGIPATATILSVHQTQLVVNRMPVLKFDLQVEAKGRAPFTTSLRKTTPELYIPQLQPGRQIPVLIDPRSPNEAILQFERIAALPPPQSESVEGLTALRTLKAMLDEGLIEPAEYEAKKAEIMERM